MPLAPPKKRPWKLAPPKKRPWKLSVRLLPGPVIILTVKG